MATGIIPTLSVNNQIIENRSDKLIYILKYLMYSPGWTSSWIDEDLMSMRKSMAQYTENSNKLVPALTNYLNTAIHHFYSDYSARIKVIRDEKNPANYSMDIYIVDSTGTVVLQLDRVRKDDSNLFIYKGVE